MVDGEAADIGSWFDWAYRGVDHSFPGNGGLDCRDFLSVSQRCLESLAACIIAGFALSYAWPRLKLPESCIHQGKQEPLGKRILLLLMCLTFGIELGFKFATRQMIWIGNPCHIATMVQIFILASPPSKLVTAAFRLQMHMLTGAPIAILFPVINTRLLPFETGVYFLQHILMLVIPFYLMYTGDPFIPEPLTDFSWALTSLGFLFVYHFVPLQLMAYVSHVNLNNMLCPAVSDPFHGPFYRIFALCHQFILILTLGKVFVMIAKLCKILPKDTPREVAAVQYFCHSVIPNTSTESSTPSTNEDSMIDGEIASAMCMLHSGHKCPESNASSRPCHCGGDCDPSCLGTYSHRSRKNSVEFSNGCCNSPVNYSTQVIANGHLERNVENEHYCRRRVHDTSNHIHSYSDTHEACRSCRSTESQLTTYENDRGLNKTLIVSDLEKPQNGQAKAH